MGAKVLLGRLEPGPFSKEVSPFARMSPRFSKHQSDQQISPRASQNLVVSWFSLLISRIPHLSC